MVAGGTVMLGGKKEKKIFHLIPKSGFKNNARWLSPIRRWKTWRSIWLFFLFFSGRQRRFTVKILERYAVVVIPPSRGRFQRHQRGICRRLGRWPRGRPGLRYSFFFLQRGNSTFYRHFFRYFFYLLRGPFLFFLVPLVLLVVELLVPLLAIWLTTSNADYPRPRTCTCRSCHLRSWSFSSSRFPLSLFFFSFWKISLGVWLSGFSLSRSISLPIFFLKSLEAFSRTFHRLFPLSFREAAAAVNGEVGGIDMGSTASSPRSPFSKN